MGDRLGTPGAVDFGFALLCFSFALSTTRELRANPSTCNRKLTKSQIKKSKLTIVTAFKVGVDSSSDFGFRCLGGAGFLNTKESNKCNLAVLFPCVSHAFPVVLCW